MHPVKYFHLLPSSPLTLILQDIAGKSWETRHRPSLFVHVMDLVLWHLNSSWSLLMPLLSAGSCKRNVKYVKCDSQPSNGEKSCHLAPTANPNHSPVHLRRLLGQSLAPFLRGFAGAVPPSAAPFLFVDGLYKFLLLVGSETLAMCPKRLRALRIKGQNWGMCEHRI